MLNVNRMRRSFYLIFIILISVHLFGQTKNAFSWPGGQVAAISLSFDDGRYTQVERGTAMLDSLKIKATFYVVPSAVEERLEGCIVKTPVNTSKSGSVGS